MKKPKLYIIHGWTYTTAPWIKTLDLLKKKGYSVEMLNVPGLTAASKKVWTIEDYTKWADRNIPTGSVALGHSNGGRILLNLCSEKPEKLKQLILLDAAGVYEASKKRDLARKVSKYLGFLKKIPGVAKVWHKLTGATDYARAPENMKKTLSNMLDSDKRLDLTKVTVPTSILWGAEDTVTPPRQAEVMHAQIPNSTLEIFPGWTHAPYISHPSELASAIAKVIQRPPVVTTPSEVDNTAERSAAFALKKASEPVLKAKGSGNSVVADVPTKLVLRTGDTKVTEGMVISDAEGAAVKYQPKKPDVATKTTNVAQASASANIKKAAIDRTPDLDAVSASASANLRKPARRRVASGLSQSSASLALKSAKAPKATEGPAPSLISELDQKSSETVDFVPLSPDGAGPVQPEPSPEATKPAKLPGAITSASVPKVSRIEKAKRRVKAVKKSRTTKRTAGRTTRSKQA